MKNYFLFTVLLFFLSGCEKNTCFENSGKVITSQRIIAPPAEVHIYDNINVIITRDTIDKLSVEAGENLHASIKTEMLGEALFIRNTAACKWLKSPSEKINVYLSVTRLNKIVYEGSGNVSSTNTLKANYFTIDSDAGAGVVSLSLNANHTRVILPREGPDIILAGSSDTCYTYCSSRATINFKNFVVKKMELDYGSVRNGFINVTEYLGGRIYHTGNVIYSGNPSNIKMEILSTGKLLRQN